MTGQLIEARVLRLPYWQSELPVYNAGIAVEKSPILNDILIGSGMPDAHLLHAYAVSFGRYQFVPRNIVVIGEQGLGPALTVSAKRSITEDAVTIRLGGRVRLVVTVSETGLPIAAKAFYPDRPTEYHMDIAAVYSMRHREPMYSTGPLHEDAVSTGLILFPDRAPRLLPRQENQSEGRHYSVIYTWAHSADIRHRIEQFT